MKNSEPIDMAKKLSDIEKVLSGLPYKHDKEGNPTLSRDLVKAAGYFEDLGLSVNERHFKDAYPKVNAAEYNQFNNLYNTGFFDGYFLRQYKLISELYSLKPENFPKPIALLVDDAGRKTGYVTASFDGREFKNYAPRMTTLRDYLNHYGDWDERLISEKMGRVTSLQDLIPKDELDSFIAKNGVKKLAMEEAHLKEYFSRKEVYEKRKAELADLRKQIISVISEVNSNNLYHDNLNLDNIIIYRNDKREVKIGIIHPINQQDAKHSFLSSDAHRVKSISRHLRYAEFSQSMLINKYTEKYRSVYPGFKSK